MKLRKRKSPVIPRTFTVEQMERMAQLREEYKLKWAQIGERFGVHPMTASNAYRRFRGKK